MKAIALWPTGFSEPSHREEEVEIIGFAQGEIEDNSKIYGTIKGMMAVCRSGNRIKQVPTNYIRFTDNSQNQEN